MRVKYLCEASTVTSVEGKTHLMYAPRVLKIGGIMYEDKIVLCGANSYEQKYYLNPDFDTLPDSVKDELKVMCVLFTEDVGGILTLVFEENGELCFEVSNEENDFFFDEIGSHLKIKELQRTKQELLEALQMYYKVFFLGEEA